MVARALALTCAMLLGALAGCVSQAPSEALTAQATEGPTLWPVRCTILGPDRATIPDAWCMFEIGPLRERVLTNANGTATRSAPAGERGIVIGGAPERASKSASVQIEGPTSIELILEHSTAFEEAPPPLGRADDVPVIITAPAPAARRWMPPVAVTTTGDEPLVTVGPGGAIYYSPTNRLFRSLDGGQSWRDISPAEALPTIGSDTSVSVAPDGTVWWSRYWGYAGSTLACRSTDQGATWSCNNLAIPGATDRMWVVGLSSSEAYLQTNQGLEENVWAHTTDGGLTFLPHGIQASSTVRNGPMVLDPATGKVWQVESRNGQLRTLDVIGGAPLLTSTATEIANDGNLPFIAMSSQALWIVGSEGSPQVGRQLHTTGTWEGVPLPTTAASTTFAIIAARGDIVAVAYYGSDVPGPAGTNPGPWSLYVARSDNANTAYPTWVETRIVHAIREGPICLGASCGVVEDNGARFSGDFIGATIDTEGNVHVAYVDDRGERPTSMFIRQAVA